MWLVPHLTYWNGGVKFIYEVVKELSKRNQIHLFIQKPSPDIAARFNQISIPVTPISKVSTSDISFWLNFSRQLKKEISFLKTIAPQYDLVISSMFPMNIIGNSLGIPHIQYCFEPYAFFWDPLMVKGLPFSKRLFLKLMKKKFSKLDIEATKKSPKVLTVNSGTQKWISYVYNRDSIPTLLGVDTSFFKQTPNETLEYRYRGKKIIIHSTDWTPLKRTNWLIDEFVKVSSEIENTILLITEVQISGVERDHAIKKINSWEVKNVEMCGFVPIDLLPSYYSLADIAVYTGIGQGASAASLFVLECMACETPVIRTSDTHEEVEHGKTGFLFEKDDKENFRRFVIELLNNEKSRDQFGTVARSFIKEKYSWKNVAYIIERNCLEILN